MSERRVIPLDRLEETLEELFGLSDGEQSEDGLESDERENEAIFLEPSQEELEDILDSPSATRRQPEIAINLLPQNLPSGSRPLEVPSAGQDSGAGDTNNDVLGNNSAESSISESEEDEDDIDDDWKKIMFPHNAPIDKFDEIPVKANQTFPNRSSPLAYFTCFFSGDVLSQILEQTNLYAAQNKQKNWIDVSAEEMQAFFGMLVLMGVHPLPNIDLYWSTDPLFCVREIADVMTSKRFKIILRNLHLNDNTKIPKRGEPDYDKLYKIRPVVNSMNTAFQKGARNSASQSIDECMVKFKGRSTLKQYMPNKPVKRGFKIWARCDSDSGYLYEFEVYTGKKGNETEFELGAAVVNSLCKAMIDENMDHIHVAFDNFFSSTELMQRLFDNKIYSTATVRSNRTNLPKKLKKVIAKKGKSRRMKEEENMKKGDYKWRVNRNVFFLHGWTLN